jgi:hypothetical protein
MNKQSYVAMLVAGILVAVALVAPRPLSAHHGWGGYSEKEFELSGTVQTPVSLSGPHATMKVLADGQVWDVVMAPPARTSAAGLKEGMIPVGAKVSLHGHRHMTAGKYEIKTERLTWNNRVFNVYPDRD